MYGGKEAYDRFRPGADQGELTENWFMLRYVPQNSRIDHLLYF